MLREFWIAFLLYPAAVVSQVIPGGSCAASADCVPNSVCIGVPNGLCFCLTPYVDSTDGQSCIYSCQENLNNPANGAVDTSEGDLVGATVYYSCNAGYTLNGDATRTCEIVQGGWTGTEPTCDEIDECTSTPCQNGGACNDLVNSYTCDCDDGYAGTHCETDINECASTPCANDGTCVDGVNGFTCTCASGFTDTLCDGDVNECQSNPCANGNCNNLVDAYSCTCTGGWTGTNCDEDIDECASDPCQNGATCFGLVPGVVDHFFCGCAPGYEDTTCSTNTDECASNPCQNGATCNDQVNQYDCSCVPGYEGTHCETDTDECASTPCQNGATCNDFVNQYNCTCVAGYDDIHCETDINECASSPCQNGATCNDFVNEYNCTCVPGYEGINCETDTDECASGPCQNGGTCTDQVNHYFCTCVAGYNGTHCENDIDECASNPCQNGATCNDQVNQYNCTCAPGYESTFCEIDTDECFSYPCQNGATCNDQVNMYNCTCVAGYSGYHCEIDYDECVSGPCQNFATCNDNVNGYTCTCAPGYESTHCEIDTNECDSSPCQNGATCTDLVNMYTCACVAGYTSTNCEIEIDECASNPCENGATCNDFVDFYNCTCKPGYDDYNCDRDIDECVSQPCQNGGTCTDFVNYFGCACQAGYTDETCRKSKYIRSEYDSQPCQNGGTCTDFVNYFGCACQAGYTDETCRKSKYIGSEYDSQPCQNGGTCTDFVNYFNCACQAGYTDETCRKSKYIRSEYESQPCQNGGTCTDFVNYFNCACQAGYTDETCRKSKYIRSEYDSQPCQNGGTCTDFVNYFGCACQAEYTDETCRKSKYIRSEYESQPCQNGGACTDFVNYFGCACQAGYTDETCRKSVLNDICHSSAGICDGILNAECDGSTCVCVTGYKDYGNASCSRVDCGGLSTPTNGVLDMTQGTLYEAVAEFQCDPGYTMVGSTTTTCQSVEAWSDLEPACQIKDCGGLSHPADGSYTLLASTTFGDVATYSCNTGYTLVGVSLRTCQSDGTWSQSAPTCSIVDCLVTAAPVQGSVTYNPNTEYLGYAEYSCNTGYTLSGSVQRQCQADGTWASTTPSCIINDCGSLSAPTDGSITLTGTTYQSLALFDCNIGYDLSGSSSRTCQADTTWDGTLTSCIIKDCGAPAAPTNGAVDFSSGTVYLNTATFTCNPGYDLSGQSSRTCQADGTWQTPFPTCVIKDCGSLTAAANTQIDTSGGTTYGSEALYSCDPGYEISSVADKRTCESTGMWSADIPVCSRVDCGTILAPADGNVDLSGGTLYQATAQFTCNTGYDLNGASSTMCQTDATWSNPNPTCDIKDCGSPSAPANGGRTLPNGTTYLSVAVFSCDTGYTMSRTPERTCLSTGSWTNPFPTCVINDCGPLSPLSNTLADSSGGSTYLSVATFTCATGYMLATAASTRTCQSDSTWSTPEPYCTKKDCGALSSPTDGLVNYAGSLYQDTATYSCDAGHTLTGVTSRVCLDTGVWDGTAPSCVIKNCGSLSSPTNGAVDTTSGTTYLQVAVYTCDTGYNLIGATTRTCNSTGSWSSLEPTCVIKDCGNLTAPVNGIVTLDSGSTYGQTAAYQCVVGYDLIGDTTRQCQSNGLWSGSVPVCQIKDCGQPPSLSNGQYSVTTTTYQSTADYSCNDNYGLVGASSVACLSTGSWGTLPDCDPDCGIPPSITDGTVTYDMGTLQGAVATYTCDGGYTMNGGATVTCRSDGSWSSAPTCTINLEGYNSPCFTTLQCETDRASCLDDGLNVSRCLCNTVGQIYDSNLDSCLTDCGGLADPTNGVVTLPTITAEGQTATYTCNPGYALSGNATRMCLASGVYSGLPPTCLTGCTLPSPPENGNVSDPQGLVAGAAITYTCSSGYTLVGQAMRVCLPDSTFNGEVPVCKKECPILPALDNGIVDLSRGYWEGSLATYICNQQYALVGKATRLCRAAGTWTGSEPTCVFSVFPSIVIVYGVILALLVVVKLTAIALFLYQRFFKKRLQRLKDGDNEPDKKPAFLPFMLERPEKNNLPPPSYAPSQGKSTKFSNNEPGVDDDQDIRQRRSVQPPEKKPLPPLKMTYRDKKRSMRKDKFDSSTVDADKSNRKPNPMNVTGYMPPESVSTARIEKVNPKVSVPEYDQASLDDFNLPKRKPVSPIDDVGPKFVAPRSGDQN